MPFGIQWNAAVQQELASRGITESTGVYGQHKVKLGKGSPIRLDEIKSATIPFAGFTKASKVERGKTGLASSAASALKTLSSRTGELDAKGLLGALKAMQVQTDRLSTLNEITEAQLKDTMWTFTAAVQSLSNRELSAVYQSFLSSEMDLLQTALLYEGREYDSIDAGRAASQLFDLQALVIKEISNRSINEQISQISQQAGANSPQAEERPQTLVGEFGGLQWLAMHPEEHDITAANLVSLAEIGSNSATMREKSAQAQQEKLNARGLDDVSVKEMGDALRKCEVTMNIKTEYLIGGANSIFDHPNDPMVNIFHLHDQGMDPKGPGYLTERQSTEDVLFPELKGRQVNADERPMYGAINYQGKNTGALRQTMGYGSSVIVLKPEVAKRATYTINDTFYSARIDVSQEKRENFYRLLDGVNGNGRQSAGGERIPESLVEALKNPSSQERKDFEAALDEIARNPSIQKAAAFKFELFPKSIMDHFPKDNDDALESTFSEFKGFLTECFGDADATRNIMATHDNLESLVTQMDDVDGNGIARSVQASKNGEDGGIFLNHAQYIEAQIQGPLIPSRDIAEIRIYIDEVPQDEQEALKAKARQYQKDTGIKVTFINVETETEDEHAIDEIDRATSEFHAEHLDQKALEKGREDVLFHLDEKVSEYVRNNPALAKGLPEGMLRLEGNALARLGGKFSDALKSLASKPNTSSVDQLIARAFEEAARPILEQKAVLLRELEAIAKEGPPMTAAQKESVVKWVVAAKALRSPNELRMILKNARAQEAILKEIAAADPPMTAAQIALRLADFASSLDKELAEFKKSLGDTDFGTDDRLSEQDRVSFMSLALLQNGEPPMDEAAMKKLYAILGSKEMTFVIRQMIAMEDAKDLQSIKDSGKIHALRSQLYLNALNAGNLVNARFRQPSPFQGELSLLQEPVRAVVRQISPQVGQALDEKHPAYAPMPAPANPQAMPQTHAERRNFCLSVMDGYLNHEKTFEKGTSVHGRGHIARAFIFGTVMCNMLEEQGINVDKNAVLCGISGHDLGRSGKGKDKWEERSANMTADAMGNAYGHENMGQAYEQEVKDCINAHKSQTVEGMLLNAADSLDFGRTGDFSLDKFPFLKGKNGEVPGSMAKETRDQLAKEANLLQRLTNPLCANYGTIHKLGDEIFNSPIAQISDYYSEEKAALEQSIEDSFAADWDVSNEDYMTRFENVVRNNPKMFPLLSKYYH